MHRSIVARVAFAALVVLTALLTIHGRCAAQTTRLAIIEPDAPRPAATSVPVPPVAAFLRMTPGALEAINPLALTGATIPAFPFPDGTRHTLRLERFDVLAPAAVVVEGTDQGDRPFAVDRHLFLRGTVDGIPGAFVYLAVFPKYCFGYIELPVPGSEMPRRLMIAPDDVAGARPTMIVFDEHDVPTSGARQPCSASDPFALRQHELDGLRDGLFGAPGTPRKDAGARVLGENILVAQIAVECEDKFFRAHSSNLSRAANYAITLMGAVSAVYQRDIRVALQVPFLRIWTTSANPYPGPNDGDLLGQLRDYWLANMQSVKHTAVTVMSSYRGGVAWVGTMCSDFGFSQTGPGGNLNFPASGYVWDVDVVGHELGHNFGSPHTHSCYWNPAIDSCWNAEGGCFPTIVPSAGSIMSYCHLTGTPRLTFLPRVATLIRAACEQYSCVTPMPHTEANDVAAVQIVVPANGATIVKASTITPSAIVRNVGTANQSNVAVTLQLTNPAGTVVYTDTKPVASLVSGATATVTFKQAVLTDTGVFVASLKVDLPNDTALVNNALVRPFQVLPTTATGTLNVLVPNGGETYLTDSTVTVTWAQTNVSEVIIELSTDNGATWNTVQWSVQGSAGTYQWKVPATPTRLGRLRLINTTDARVVDMSDAAFTITLDKDVQPLEFLAPQSNDSNGSPFTPQLSVRNNGAKPLTNLPVELTLLWRAGRVVAYDTTILLGALGPNATATMTFPATRLLPDGDLVMIARTKLEGDRAISNDSLGRTITVVRGLAPPSMVRAVGLERAAAVQWSSSITPGITGYRIYRGPDPESLRPLVLVRPSVHAWVDHPLADDSIYYYAITAVRDSTESIFSPVAMADPTHIIAGDTLRPPSLLSPARDARDLPFPVSMIWRTVAGAELYQVQIAADAACTDVIENEIVTAPMPVSPDVLVYGGSYFWRVRAFNNTFTGPWSPVWNFALGRNCANDAVKFDGAASGVRDTNFLWQGGAVTVEFWNYISSADISNASAFGVGATDNTHNRFQAHAPWGDRTLYWDYGTLEGDTGRLAVSYAPYVDKWTHVALVSNGKDFKAIYLDGELAASGTLAGSPRDLTVLRIGSASTGIFPYKGTVDEFRIWDRVRTQEQIRRSMYRSIDAEAGLAARYRFDEGSGTFTNGLNPPPAELLANTQWARSNAPISCVTAADVGEPALVTPAASSTIPSSPFTLFTWSAVPGASAYQLDISTTAAFDDTVGRIQNIGTTAYTFGALAAGRQHYWRVRAVGANGPGLWSPTGTFTTGSPCVEQALALNGVDNWVDIPRFTFSGRATTVECWLYVDTADVRDSWLFYTAAADSSMRMSSHAPWSDRKLTFDYGAFGSGGRISTDYAPYLSRWTHVAMVSDGRELKAIYLNGKLVAAEHVARRLAGPRTGLVIGGNRNGVGFFKGTVTEFRVWNTARSQAAIREHMFQRIDGPRSGLLGCWPLAGVAETDSVVADVSGFGNDAVVHGTRTWVTGPAIGSGAAVLGPLTVLPGAAGNVYSVSDSTANTYQWSVIGGTIVSDASKPTITVDWGGGPQGTVVVVVTRDGCARTSALDVAINDGSAVPPASTGGSTLAARIVPNPARAGATLIFEAPSANDAMVEIFDALGRSVRTIGGVHAMRGENRIAISVDGLPTGSYYCRLHVGTDHIVIGLDVVR